MLTTFVRAHDLGRVFPAAIKVVLDEPTGVGPGVAFISTERLGGLKEDGFYGAPDLIVEVVSARPSLDCVVKRDKYASAGVPTTGSSTRSGARSRPTAWTASATRSAPSAPTSELWL